MSELLLQDELVAGPEFVTADSSAALRNDNKRTGNDKDKSYSRSSAARRMTNLKGVELELDEEDGTPFDKLREECGVMAVYNHRDAARLTYWGLYALLHHGQEAAGIASA